MSDYLGKAALGEYNEQETCTGNADRRTIYYAMQAMLDNGVAVDDRWSEWEVLEMAFGCNVEGTITLQAMDSTGAVTTIAGPITLPDKGSQVIPIGKFAGAGKDVVFSTTGGGNWWVRVRARAHHHGYSRPAMAEVP